MRSILYFAYALSLITISLSFSFYMSYEFLLFILIASLSSVLAILFCKKELNIVSIAIFFSLDSIVLIGSSIFVEFITALSFLILFLYTLTDFIIEYKEVINTDKQEMYSRRYLAKISRIFLLSSLLSLLFLDLGGYLGIPGIRAQYLIESLLILSIFLILIIQEKT
ncbi:MAG: hypothetical protein B6U94_03730 [Thermofilum sp. ex4484_79]|nr:MAG: hypothetical protein B6U94_03730 [Thermofilum sp. ex4484_79]